MNNIESPEVRTGMIHDLIDKGMAVRADTSRMIAAGTFVGEERYRINFEHDKIFLGILELREGQPIPGVEVEIFEPREAEESHPFQGNLVKLIVPTDDGVRSFYSNLSDLSQVVGINSMQVREIIGTPDRQLEEKIGKTAHRLVNELGDLKRKMLIADRENFNWIYPQIGIIAEKLLRMWINGQSENLTIGDVKSGNKIVFRSTVGHADGQKKPLDVYLNTRKAWLQMIEQSGRGFEFNLD